jgi:hypothetical protein
MTILQATMGHLATVLLWIALVGIAWRRRYREWLFLPIFVLTIAAWGVVITLWPRFYVQEVWMIKEGFIHLFRVVMALELALRTFRAFPGAMATLRRLVFVLMVITISVILAKAPAALRYESFVGEFQPRVVAAAIWLFMAIAVLILWYRLPVSRFQKAIVLSYVAFLPILAAYMNLLGDLGWPRTRLFGYVYQFSWLALASYWAYVSWRPDKPQPPSEEPDEPGPLA